MNRVVFDVAAFDVISSRKGTRLRYLLEQTVGRGGEIWCAAVTIAEVARGVDHTRNVESALKRPHGGKRINVLPTDTSVAKLVGAILYSAGRGSEAIADAHVVAACAAADLAVVVTADPDDIMQLAAAVPGVRVVTRAP